MFTYLVIGFWIVFLVLTFWVLFKLPKKLPSLFTERPEGTVIAITDKSGNLLEINCGLKDRHFDQNGDRKPDGVPVGPLRALFAHTTGYFLMGLIPNKGRVLKMKYRQVFENLVTLPVELKGVPFVFHFNLTTEMKQAYTAMFLVGEDEIKKVILGIINAAMTTIIGMQDHVNDVMMVYNGKVMYNGVECDIAIALREHLKIALPPPADPPFTTQIEQQTGLEIIALSRTGVDLTKDTIVTTLQLVAMSGQEDMKQAQELERKRKTAENAAKILEIESVAQAAKIQRLGTAQGDATKAEIKALIDNLPPGTDVSLAMLGMQLKNTPQLTNLYIGAKPPTVTDGGSTH